MRDEFTDLVAGSTLTAPPAGPIEKWFASPVMKRRSVLILVGGSASVRTHLCCWYLLHNVSIGVVKAPVFIPERELLEAFRDHFGGEPSSQDKARSTVKSLSTASFCFINNVADWEAPLSSSKRTLYTNLLMSRIEAGLPTLLAARHQPDWGSCVGQELAEAMAQSSEIVPIQG